MGASAPLGIIIFLGENMSEQDININISKTEPTDATKSDKNEKSEDGKLRFEVDLHEAKAPILEAGQTGEIIIPVKIITQGKKKSLVEQNGPMRTHGDFSEQTASQLKESLPKADR